MMPDLYSSPSNATAPLFLPKHARTDLQTHRIPSLTSSKGDPPLSTRSSRIRWEESTSTERERRRDIETQRVVVAVMRNMMIWVPARTSVVLAVRRRRGRRTICILAACSTDCPPRIAPVMSPGRLMSPKMDIWLIVGNNLFPLLINTLPGS